ncbi:MAG: hypothetical protein GJ680_18240 [Alteromonadaceae bacterium]|nr:hypothetical protein [Alteromonadaceae bacterium]
MANDRQVEVVFMEDFTFLAVGGWADGSRISSVNIAGRELNYDVIEDNIVSLLPDETLVPGTEYTIEVVAEDDSANSITREFNIMYSPAQFRVSDVPEQVFAYTHRFSGRLSQSAGKKCRFSTTPEVAIASSTAFYKGCVVTFPTIPEGVTTSLRRSSVDFYGNINMEGTINVPYEVVYYNRDGLSKSVFEGSFTVESLPTPPISLTMLDENQVQEGIYSLPYNAKRITKFEVVGTSGEIKVTTQAGSQSNEKTVRGTRRFGMREMKMRLERLDTEETKVWDMVPYTVSALHTNIPDEVATETFNVLITPHSGTRAYLDIEAIPDGTTEDEYAVSIRAGIYNRREKTYIYDAQTMGMWTAQMGYTQRREIVPFGDIFELDENGEATTVMSGQEMFDINSRFVVILRSVSPVEGFDKEIVSRPQFVRVLKGEAVEGDINKNEIVDRVPFRVRAKYSYASRDDSRVAGDRTWQVSYDGENFADIPESQSTTYSFSVTDPSTAFYRYKVVNAYTGAEGYSSIMKVVGYDVPDLTLGGPRTLLRDQQGEFTVTVNDEVYTAEDMTFEWSLDNGETWNEDATSITHQAAENFLVQVRARLDNSADEVGSRAYDTASRSVKIIPPEPVKIRIDGARYGEVGFAYELEASVSHDRDLVAQDIVSEWRLPDGTVVEDTSISHTISEEDVVEKYVTFTFAAWIRDYKEETLREVNKRVFAHHYIFPEGRMGAGTRVAMAPSTGKAWVTRHDTSVPGVDFDYEWQVDDAVTILSQSSTRMSFQINEPGTHMISSIVRDNRGNEQLYTTFVEAMEIAPMEITVESQSSKENMRAPLTMRFKPSIRLKHPNDGVDYYEIEYDGEVKQTTSTYNYVDINEAGVHDVTFRVYSDFGQMGEVVMPIEVLPNLPPECAPAVEYRNERHYVYHNCTDDNLVNVHYAWEDGSFDDVGESLYFRNDNFPSETVTITATDLLGETTITTVSW